MKIKFVKNYRNNWETDDGEYEIEMNGISEIFYVVRNKLNGRYVGDFKKVNDAKREVREIYERRG